MLYDPKREHRLLIGRIYMRINQAPMITYDRYGAQSVADRVLKSILFDCMSRISYGP